MSGLAANSPSLQGPYGPLPTPVLVSECPQEPLAAHFWKQWQNGQSPVVGEFVAECGLPATEVLLSILAVDQRERWRRGERVSSESYLEQFPALASQSQTFSLILGEITLSRALGGLEPLSDYERRFPNFARQLHALCDSNSITIFDLELENTPAVPSRKSLDDQAQTVRLQRPIDGTVVEVVAPLSRPTLPIASRSPDAPRIERIGAYQIVGVLARGGMGVIYRAIDTQLKRTVALKMILSGAHADADTFERFRVEAEAVAQLQHPNIVQIHQVGEHDRLPYLALEFVDGPSLQHVIAKAPMPAVPAADLIRILARAIDFAHQRGIIHRDLKPGNILLAAGNPSGIPTDRKPGTPPRLKGLDYLPKITDFGLAKLYRDSDSSSRPEEVIGTPNYMAPEQAEGTPDSVGPGVDVYSLGAVLYEMLTGQPPFHGGSPMETLMRVRLSALVPPRHYSREIPPDLETICLKCLQKDRNERYGSAAALADDLDRFLAGRPILARPVSSAERAWKWCRRHPAIVTLAASLALLFVVANIAIVYLWQNAVAAQKDAHEKFQALTIVQLQEVDARRENERARAIAERKQYAMLLLGAETEWLRYDAVAARDMLHTCETERRGWEWRYLNRMLQGSEVTIAAPVGCTAIHILPNNRQFAALGWDGNIRVWNLETGQPIRDQILARNDKFPTGWVVSRAEFNRDGSRIVAAFRPFAGPEFQVNNIVGVWDTASGKLLQSWICSEGTPVRLAFSNNGKLVAWVSSTWIQKRGSDSGEWKGGELRVLEIADGKTQLQKSPPTEDSGFIDVTFSLDDSRLAVTQPRQALTVFDAKTGVEAFRAGDNMDGQRVWYLANGTGIAVLSGHELHFYDGNGKLLNRLSRREAGIDRVNFSPNCDRIVCASAFNTVRIYETATRLEMFQFAGHLNWVTLAVMSPDSRTLVTCSRDDTIKVWNLERGNDPQALGDGEYKEGVWIPTVAFDRAGRRLFAASDDHKLRVYDVASGRKVGEWVVGDVRSLMLSPDGKTLALGFDDIQGQVGLFDSETGTMIRKFKAHEDCVTNLAFNKEGDRLASASEDGTAKLWDVHTGVLLAKFRGHIGYVNGVAFHPDGRQIVTAGDDGTVRYWDMATGAETRSFKAHGSPVTTIAISPDGRFLATANTNRDLRNISTEIKIWNPETGALLHSMTGHTNSIWHLAFSPDSTRLASAGEDTTVKIWDPSNGDLLLTLKRHYDDVRCVAFSRDGHRLASSGDDPFLRLWDATPVP